MRNAQNSLMATAPNNRRESRARSPHHENHHRLSPLPESRRRLHRRENRHPSHRPGKPPPIPPPWNPPPPPPRIPPPPRWAEATSGRKAVAISAAAPRRQSLFMDGLTLQIPPLTSHQAHDRPGLWLRSWSDNAQLTDWLLSRSTNQARFAQTIDFHPEAIRAPTAYCNLKPPQQAVAQTIIDLAKGGERDLERLCDAVSIATGPRDTQRSRSKGRERRRGRP